MKETRRRDGTRFGVSLARIQVAIISQDDMPLLIINRERILHRRLIEMIQRRIDSRDEHEKTDDQKRKGFEKSVHGGGHIANLQQL